MIKERLKKNVITYYPIKKIRQVQYFVSNTLFFNLKKYLRVMNIIRNSQYNDLKKFKNINNGERCFIIATGPSLSISDLEMLRDEVTFSMNSICLAFNDTNWRPTYYGIQDVDVYKKLKEEIFNMNLPFLFVGDTISKKFPVPKGSIIYPLNMLNHAYPHKNYKTKFSNDSFAEVFDGYTITYSLIQIAVYMGFKEVYLLGADCTYNSNMKHHFREHGVVDKSFETAGDRMITGYKEAKTFSEKNNVKIFNATRGGMLEVFERVQLEEVINKKESK